MNDESASSSTSVGLQPVTTAPAAPLEENISPLELLISPTLKYHVHDVYIPLPSVFSSTVSNTVSVHCWPNMFSCFTSHVKTSSEAERNKLLTETLTPAQKTPVCTFLPLRSQQTACWPGSTSPPSPQPARSCPQTLCTLPAGWPDGRRQEYLSVMEGCDCFTVFFNTSHKLLQLSFH